MASPAIRKIQMKGRRYYNTLTMATSQKVNENVGKMAQYYKGTHTKAHNLQLPF